MTDPPNTDSNGAALMMALNETGLPSTLKGKVARLLVRFVAGSVAHPYVQQVRDNLDTLDGRSRINALVADAVAQKLIADPEYMERAQQRLVGELFRKQDNVEAVAALAHAKAGAAGDGETEVEEDAPEPSQDWLNNFTAEAEQASSDELRDRLAGVLAGEARKPGSFSRATVRKVAEMERTTLEQFQRVLVHRLGDAVFTDREWQEGEWFEIGSALETEGLITGSGGMTHRRTVLSDDGMGFLLGDEMAMTFIGKPGTEKRLGIWLMTRIGLEIASLLPPIDCLAAMTRIARSVDKEGLSEIWAGPFLKLGGDRVNVGRQFKLWSDSDEVSD